MKSADMTGIYVTIAITIIAIVFAELAQVNQSSSSNQQTNPIPTQNQTQNNTQTQISNSIRRFPDGSFGPMREDDRNNTMSNNATP